MNVISDLIKCKLNCFSNAFNYTYKLFYLQVYSHVFTKDRGNRVWYRLEIIYRRLNFWRPSTVLLFLGQRNIVITAQNLFVSGTDKCEKKNCFVTLKLKQICRQTPIQGVQIHCPESALGSKQTSITIAFGVLTEW